MYQRAVYMPVCGLATSQQDRWTLKLEMTVKLQWLAERSEDLSQMCNTS